MIAHNLTPIENEETSMRDDPTRGFGLLTMKRSEVSQSRHPPLCVLLPRAPHSSGASVTKAWVVWVGNM